MILLLTDDDTLLTKKSKKRLCNVAQYMHSVKEILCASLNSTTVPSGMERLVIFKVKPFST